MAQNADCSNDIFKSLLGDDSNWAFHFCTDSNNHDSFVFGLWWKSLKSLKMKSIFSFVWESTEHLLPFLYDCAR